MGLDIIAHEVVKLTAPHMCGAECDGEHVLAFVYDGMERSLAGLKPGRCYRPSGRTVSFRAGSYLGYDTWRNDLCRAVLGIDARTVWADPDAYADSPFIELIYFADNEGTVGPVACANLADDFAAYEQQALCYLLSCSEWHAEQYRLWQEAFELAADGGLVRFC